MSAATFVMQDTQQEGERVYRCTECDQDILATETDSHAHRKHRAANIRVFQTWAGFLIWQDEEKGRA